MKIVEVQSRNEQIVAMYQAKTMQEIGDHFAISRQAVHQILQKAGVARRRTGRRRMPRPTCAREGCNKPAAQASGRYCSRQHYTKGFITVTCETCGKQQERRRAVIESAQRNWQNNRFRNGPQDKFFCNKTCFGKWAGQNHGFAKHPENARRAR